MSSEYNEHVVVSNAALVYTTYLEEFASVLVCICLTALTDPDPNISLEESSMWLALSVHRVAAKNRQRAFVLTNSCKTNSSFAIYRLNKASKLYNLSTIF